MLGFIFLNSQIYAQRNSGVGHSQTIRNATATELKDVQFTQHNQDDFNRDNVPDKLICNMVTIKNKRRINIEIKDGKTNKTFFKWNWDEKRAVRPDGSKLILTGCDIVHLAFKRPSIILSTAYASPKYGVRVRAPQFIIHNQPNNKLVPKHIFIPGRKEFFTSASRSVKCTQVPYKLRQAGAKNGALCFYAGYDSGLPLNRGYGTVTALVKFEQGVGNSFIVKDLTSSTKLPWSGGMLGTHMNRIRTVRMCNGAGKYDGLHMMSGAFVDYNRDGLKDLVTVGQHASIRSHQMVIDKRYPEKFYFKNAYISDVRSGMSEFLRVISLDENEQQASSSCVYISGEKFNGCGSVPDHMRCFKNGKWETSYPHGPRFSSTLGFLSVKANGKGKYVVKAADIRNGKKVGDRNLSIHQAYEPKITLSVGKVKKDKNNVTVNGWACVKNTGWRPRITVSSKAHHKTKGYKKYFQKITHINSEPMLSKVCMQPKTYPLRFKAVIPKKNLQSQKGKLYIQADFYHLKKLKHVKHVNKVLPY